MKSIAETATKEISYASYPMTVVTPMFGGSESPWRVNCLQPIRSSSVRGHLRFWWRATRGAACKDAAALHDKETEIFGSTDKPSPVKIWITQSHDKDSTDSPFKPKFNNRKKKNELVLDKSKFPSYALFPLANMEEEEKADIKYLVPGYHFTVNIQYELHNLSSLSLDKLKLEVECALWAWVNFGGIGARTRRGCGSLYCEKLAPAPQVNSLDSYRQWFQKCLDKYELLLEPDGPVRDWPTLSGSIMVAPIPEAILDSWKHGIERYRSFRSKRSEKRDPTTGQKQFGRSHWPEADSIRALTGTGLKRHLKSTTLPRGAAFPRAQLGLPIIFHFKQPSARDRRDPNEGYEPFDTSLMPEDGDRLASPLIVKALAISPFKAYAAAIALNQPKLGKLKLMRQSKRREDNHWHYLEFKREFTKATIESDQIYSELNYLPDREQNNPMIDRIGRKTGSTIKAFMATLSTKKEGDEPWTPLLDTSY